MPITPEEAARAIAEFNLAWLPECRFLVHGAETDGVGAIAALSEHYVDAQNRADSLSIGVLPPGMAAADEATVRMMYEAWDRV